MAPGGFVVHRASKVHYDRANDEDCVIEIYGMGPATSTLAGGGRKGGATRRRGGSAARATRRPARRG